MVLIDVVVVVILVVVTLSLCVDTSSDVGRRGWSGWCKERHTGHDTSTTAAASAVDLRSTSLRSDSHLVLWLRWLYSVLHKWAWSIHVWGTCRQCVVCHYSLLFTYLLIYLLIYLFISRWRSLHTSAMRIIVLHLYTKFKVRRDMAHFQSLRSVAWWPWPWPFDL